MLIVCPNCATSYDLDTASLRPSGRRVRCVRCRTVWLAELSHADKLLAAVEELAPVRRAVEAVAEVTAAGAADRLPDPSDVVPGALPSEVPSGAVSAESEIALSIEADQPTDSVFTEAPADSSSATHDASVSGDAEPLSEAPEVDSPPTVPADLDHAVVEPDLAAPIEHETEQPENIESFAARRLLQRAKPANWLRWPLTQVQTATLVLIVLDAIIIGWRADFVRLLPQTASFYAMIGLPVNLRGLSFDGLATTTEQHEGVPILVVEGTIVNDSRKMADIPHLRFAVRNAAHQDIYSWNAAPPRTPLPPGQAATFRTRLASPPPDAHDVLVRFLNRHDVMNGNR
jgi:predicted Zn finger-like uncharacterized protein